MRPLYPVIPTNITVHLGAPDEDAQNVTVPYDYYLKNVASSEIYPTWPENAIRANIYAQASFALNRIFTEYYRSQGYDFDITNSTAYDQYFVYGRDIFENISEIVNDLYDSYIRRTGFIEPLFAQYCDGINVTCEGLSQWGTVDLAEQGFTPFEILKYYYGDDIEIVTNAEVSGITESAPTNSYSIGSAGNSIRQIQIRLNRISKNYPAIPKIYPVDGIFGIETENAVKAFQEIFGLDPDGIVGRVTWYEIQFVYNAVKRLNDLNSEGITLEDIDKQFSEKLKKGDEGLGVLVLQHFLDYISDFVPTVTPVTVDGSFGDTTENSVLSFQQTYGLTQNGEVDGNTWDVIYNVYLGLIESLPLVYTEGTVLPFPGRILREGITGDDVRLLQNYLNYIADTYTSIPKITPDGDFGPATTAAVKAFQSLFGIVGTPGTVSSVTWNAITNVYEDLYTASLVNEGQYPGYEIS